ncbi:transposase [Paludibaculum fermentans]|uniref:Transposase n=1 Tax=Paludibaculum fermentans TaxID=1473598 RepID=A0A7S7NJW8_PALFE|nr:transposase [Paludibaculum fermentans]QOY84919.1 transposase [Paludibaculum fermentans]
MHRQAEVRPLPCPQLVTQAALEHRTLFRGDRDRFVYLALVRRAVQRFSWSVLGYCLLPERTHLVLSAPDAQDLHSGIRWLRRSFSSYLREDRGDRRRLWHGGYGVQALAGQLVWPALACIELEPQRTGLAEDACEYAWSSGPAHLASQRPYVALDDSEWRPNFGPQRWREYLEGAPGDFEYWRMLRWTVTTDFIPAGRSQKTCEVEAGQSEPAVWQTSLSFGD